MLGLVRIWMRSFERIACEIRDSGHAVVRGHPECYLIVLPIADGGSTHQNDARRGTGPAWAPPAVLAHAAPA
jgi:hypothetical protein